MNHDSASAPATFYDVEQRQNDPVALETGMHEAEANNEKQERAFNFNTLYRDYYQQLVSSLKKAYGSGPPDPEDIAQQAFHNVMAQPAHKPINDIKGYLWQTARNLLFKSNRKKKEVSIEDIEEHLLFFAATTNELSPERVIIARQQITVINEALDNMPLKRRRAFILHRFENLTVSAAAKKLKISRSTANEHIVRATIDLHRAIKQAGGTTSDKS